MLARMPLLPRATASTSLGIGSDVITTSDLPLHLGALRGEKERGDDEGGSFTDRVEAFEKRADAQFAKEFIIALPVELSREQNIALVDAFVATQVLARGQVAFYASTPAYRPVLDCHGWGDLQPRLNALSKEGKWAEMGALLSDELVNEVVIHGSPEEVGERLRARAGDWCGRASPVLYAGDLEIRERLVRAIKRS